MRLLWETIKSSTISKYLTAVSKLYIAYGLEDHRQNRITKQQSYLIRNVLLEQKRWELMPNRRDPLTWEMVNHLHEISSNDSPHFLYQALDDWFAIGMYVGFRLSEWTQAKSRIPYANDTAQNKDDSPTAFTLSDFSFTNEKSQQLQLASISADSAPAFVRIRWQIQRTITMARSSPSLETIRIQDIVLFRHAYVKLTDISIYLNISNTKL